MAWNTVIKVRTVSLVAGLVLAIVVSTVALAWLRTSENPDSADLLASRTINSASISAHAAEPPHSEDEDALQKQVDPSPVSAEPVSECLVGTWHLEKHGQRTITIHMDGTAKAQVRLNLLGALLYGEKLTLDLTWSVEQGVMTQTITGGEPAGAVSRLIRDWGAQRRYHIVEVNKERLVLTEVDDDNDRDVWTSAATNEQGHERISSRPD